MGKKSETSKMAKKLAILITSKIGCDDKVEEVANRVLNDYFAATKIVKEYGQSMASKKEPSKKRQTKTVKWGAAEELQSLM